jgi:hypothetical protein
MVPRSVSDSHSVRGGTASSNPSSSTDESLSALDFTAIGGIEVYLRSLHLRHRAGLREEVGPGSRQAVELDHKKREAILHKCSSSSTSGRSLRRSGNWPSSTGVGPRVGESAFGKIARFPYAAPYEDITLKAS